MNISMLYSSTFTLWTTSALAGIQCWLALIMWVSSLWRQSLLLLQRIIDPCVKTERSPLQPLMLSQHTPKRTSHQSNTSKSAMPAGRAVPAGHAVPAVLTPTIQASMKDNRGAVDVCCNALYGDATAADSPDSSGHCQTPMSRLGTHVPDDIKENIRPLVAGSAFKRQLTQGFHQAAQSPEKQSPSGRAARQLHQRLSHPSAEVLSHQPSQPAADVCLFGSPPRHAETTAISPARAIVHDTVSVQNRKAPAAQPISPDRASVHDTVRVQSRQADCDAADLADDGGAEQDFMQLLEAAQHQRVSMQCRTMVHTDNLLHKLFLLYHPFMLGHLQALMLFCN